jgi:hypothetical protein
MIDVEEASRALYHYALLLQLQCVEHDFSCTGSELDGADMEPADRKKVGIDALRQSAHEAEGILTRLSEGALLSVHRSTLVLNASNSAVAALKRAAALIKAYDEANAPPKECELDKAVERFCREHGLPWPVKALSTPLP